MNMGSSIFSLGTFVDIYTEKSHYKYNFVKNFLFQDICKKFCIRA